MRRLYLIGIDAAPLWILREMSENGGIAGFGKLLDRGLITEMKSTLPPLTGPAWPTIYTGLSPAQHGVPDFFVMKKDYTPDIVYYDSRKVPPFWKKLSKKGIRCLVITPATVIDLPEYGNVDMITGFPLPARTNSKALEQLMKKRDFYGEPDVEVEMKSGRMSEREALSHYLKSIRSRIAIAEAMIAEHKYGLVYVCFTETDRMQHFVMGKSGGRRYLKEIYTEIGSFVQRIMKRVDDEGSAMMIVSDHGAQPIRYKFLLNAWLIENGYVRLKPARGRNAAKEQAARRNQLRESIIGNYLLRRTYDRLPYGMKRAVFRGFGALFPLPAGAGRLHLFDFDMGHTKAFAAISNNPVATIWINDKRFASGIVGSRGRNLLKDELARKLKLLRSRDGSPLVAKVIDGDSYYGRGGKFIHPDLLVEAKEGYTFDIFNYSNDFFARPEGAKSGDHLMHGIFGYYSKGTGVDAHGISVLNVAPTILDYFGATSGKVAGSRLARLPARQGY